VLATSQAVDFVYTCDAHLSDRGFATRVSADGGTQTVEKKLGLNDEEIEKIKEEWEETQKRKEEKAKAKEKEKEAEDKKDDKSDKDKDKKKASTSPKQQSPSVSATPSPPSHERYILHRDIFTMRLAEHKKRRQVKQAKEVAPRLPGAPRGEL